MISNTTPTIKKSLKTAAIAAAALTLALLQGCATGPNANPEDPLEPFNRTVYNFNDGLDRAVLKPVATVYRDATPQLVRTGVTNFFSNLGDLVSLVNNALQGKPVETTDTLFRLTTNTVFGLGGIFDVASDLGIEKHKEDFGQTLGVWGLESGPYVVLPLFGPSTVRDTGGLVVDSQFDVVGQTSDVSARNSMQALRLVNLRANLLAAGDLLEQSALDKYSFTRDVYLQRRRAQIGGKAVQEERYDLPESGPAAATPAAVAPAR
ncbi:MAG: VacJ family lipoprotein [Comamonadaceae bacterium]|nr:MAG: VacJ family lipoprotein [Comamonadaceae bacterium]